MAKSHPLLTDLAKWAMREAYSAQPDAPVVPETVHRRRLTLGIRRLTRGVESGRPATDRA